jgi:hypothetical protein
MSVRFACALGLRAGLLLWEPWMPPTSASWRHGKVILQEKCGRCHAVEAVGESPLNKAPPRRLRLRNSHSRWEGFQWLSKSAPCNRFQGCPARLVGASVEGLHWPPLDHDQLSNLSSAAKRSETGCSTAVRRGAFSYGHREIEGTPPERRAMAARNQARRLPRHRA